MTKLQAHLESEKKLQELASSVTGNLSATAVGDILQSMSSQPPTGYLLCDGAEISKTAFAKLFGIIGTQYGIGNGKDTFRIPDLRGSFTRSSPSSNVTGKSLGQINSYIKVEE